MYRFITIFGKQIERIENNLLKVLTSQNLLTLKMIKNSLLNPTHICFSQNLNWNGFLIYL